MDARWMVLMLVAGMLAGCTAEEPETEDTFSNDGASPDPYVDPATNQTPETPANETPVALPIINVTLSYGELALNEPVDFTIEADAEDPATATYTFIIYDATMVDGVANLGAVRSEASGEGLPATESYIFESAGLYAMVANVTAPDHEPGEDMVVLEFEETGEVEEIPEDPCEGVGTQAPITRSGSALAGVIGITINGVQTHNIDVGPCQENLRAKITMDDTNLDTDWYLFNPAGQQVDGHETSTLWAENDLVFNGDLDEGRWKIRVNNYMGVDAGYSFTVTFG